MNFMYEKTILLFVLINIPIVFFYNKLVNFINLNDHPDKVRKFHDRDIPLFGGILIIYNLVFFVILDYFFNLNYFQEIGSKREYLSFFTGLLFFFCIGIFDDKYNLSANKKLFLNFFILLFLTLVDDNLVIKQLTFSFIENPIYLNNFSHLFTILCVLLFINAINMFDGINLQTGAYCIVIFAIFLLKDIYIFISLILVCSLTIFLYFNFLNKIFLGDSGSHILAFLISFIIIKSYNLNQEFTADEIFIILSFPGLDMFRLFVVRIFKGKNPFSPDRNHIHHLIQKKINKFQTFLIIQACILSNIVLFYMIENKLNILFLTILTYLILYIIFIKKGKKIE
jgi:UDP-GlcNAc:undecaprenyl-phosphate GlcNAc-1-phosphate transferase